MNSIIHRLFKPQKFIYSFAIKSHAMSTASKPPKDWKVEKAQPSEYDKIIRFVQDNFYVKEPLCSALIPGQKPEIIEKLLRGSLEQELSLVARSSSDNSVIGVAINELSYKDDADKLFKLASETGNKQLSKLLETWAIYSSEPKLHENLGVDIIFHHAVLSVSESWGRRGIGGELIKQSLQLARDKNMKYVKMQASSEFTSKIAEKLQFTLCWSVPFNDILNRGSIKPRAIPEAPHVNVSIWYINLHDLANK